MVNMKSILALVALLAVQISAQEEKPTITLDRKPGSTPTSEPRLPYPVVDMIWEGTLSNGENVTLTGSIEEIAKELEKVDPARQSAEITEIARRDALEPRYPTGQTCTLPGGYEYVYVNRPFGKRPIEDGIKHLKTVGGGCGVNAGSCVRVSCSYDTAVYLCNNNGYHIAPSCHYLGSEHLQWINDSCEFNAVYCCPSEIVEVCGGIRYDSDNYSLWLFEQSC